MKAISNLLIAALLFAACSSEKKLDRETALKLLKDKSASSQIVDDEIYRSDPEEAKKILDAGLEGEGLVIVQKTQSLDDAGKPLVTFTEKAKPYLLPLSPKEEELDVQKVKVAEEVIEEVTGVQMLDGDKKAVVEYTTTYKNVTPFSKVHQLELTGKKTHKASFALFDDGWRLEK